MAHYLRCDACGFSLPQDCAARPFCPECGERMLVSKVMSDIDVVAVLGYPQHGKTTFSKLLSEFSGKPTGTTSQVIMGFLSEIDGKAYGKDWHASVDPSLHNEFRKRLVIVGDALAHLRPHIFSEVLYSQGCRIIDGIRRKEELQAWKTQLALEGKHLKIVWISRPDIPVIADNTSVRASDADVEITNTELSELASDARHLLACINWPGGQIIDD